MPDNDLKNLIESIDAPADKKSLWLEMLEKGDAQGAVKAVGDYMQQYNADFEQKYGAQIRELEQIDADAEKELSVAEEEYNDQMKSVEDEFNQVSEEASGKIDDINLQQARTQINQ